jgi:hypothetical protein
LIEYLHSASTGNWLQPILPTIVGGLLALAGGIAGGHWARAADLRRARRSLASAFEGEVGALLALSERRKYVQGLDDLIAEMTASSGGGYFYFHAKRNYFGVFQRNLDKVGLLMAPLPKLLVTFYLQAYSVLDDIEDLHGRSETSSPEESLRRHTELRDVLADTLGKGKELLPMLAAAAK